MVKSKQSKQLKGSSLWALTYAFTSLKNYPVRNMGIALVLAIGIALPTTVFVWTDTGTRIVVDDYFSNSTYQLLIARKPGAPFSLEVAQQLIQAADANPYVEFVHRVVSAVGILQNETLPQWSTYALTGFNYPLGIKDTRTIFVTPDFLGNWSSEFSYQGNFSLTSGQVLVSQGFIDYTYQVHGIRLKIGDRVDFDILENAQRFSGRNDKSQFSVLPVENLTIAGIYDLNNMQSHIADALPSVVRKNWDPFQLNNDYVLGINDSVMILQDDIGELNLEYIASWSYFSPALLIRAAEGPLLQAGAANIADNLIAFKSQFEEQFATYSISGLTDIWQLEAEINTYLQSQVLTVVAFPVIIMSMMLTVYTSETSISRRKGEISALRAKGASFNQVFATFMWESLVLSMIGLAVGLIVSFFFAPLVGSTTALFTFSPQLYAKYLAKLSVPILSIVIAAVIAMYLPAAYLLHVARRVDVSEVGQPMAEAAEEGAETGSIWRYGIGLGAVLSILMAMPILLSPTGFFAVGEILVATLLLFAASYLGSRTMRYVTARLSGSTNFLLGEKALYLSQSLRKRKGQFIPLLIILTLTLTTTTMMLIQTSSFEATMHNELQYSIGADMRIQCDPKPFSFNETLLQYPGVVDAMPVVETWAQVSSSRFNLEGVDAMKYADIGKFSDASFVGNNSDAALSALAAVPNGIIISDYSARLWNKTVGDTLFVYVGALNETRIVGFVVVGLVNSAPGFGVASTQDLAAASFASQFGFQAGEGGFAIANLDFVSHITSIRDSELFFVKTACYTDMSAVISHLDSEKNTYVYTVDTFDINNQSSPIRLFLSGIQGLTSISFILCAAMGLMAIALFLGSAVLERKSEYALFRALGGTQRQVISMVFGEFAGSVIAAISISVILGVVFGFAISIMTFGISPFSPVLPEIFAYPFLMMLVTIAAESAVMIAACYIPAKRAGAMDPATVLRNL